MINLSTRNEKQRERTRQLRLMAIAERRLAKQINTVLNRFTGEAVRGFERGGGQSFSLALTGLQPALFEVLSKNLDPLMRVFAADVSKNVAQEKSLASFETKEAHDGFIQGLINRYMLSHVFNIAGEMTNTTQNDMQRIITAAVLSGADEVTTGRDIRRSLIALNRSRSETIARTETHSAAMDSQTETARELVPQAEKEWITSGDDRVRSFTEGDQFSHRAINGQRRPIDGFFDVPGRNGTERLRFPGDPNGSAGNIINCRCVQGFITPEFA